MSERRKGSMIVSRTTGGGPDRMRLVVEDEASGTRFLEAEMSLEDFAQAITASYGEVEFVLRASNVGKTREVKEEVVVLPDTIRKADESATAELLEPYEMDGWVGRRSDLFNNHRTVEYRDGGVARCVTFVRFVEVEG
jgi:hypothetical protein